MRNPRLRCKELRLIRELVGNLRRTGKLRAFQTGLAVACLFLLGQSGKLWGATYDVGPGQPFRTIASVPEPAPGDVVQIHCGTYHEVRNWTTSGTAAYPIILKGVCGTMRPLIDATGLSVTGNGSIPRAIWQIEGSHYVIDGLEFRNARNGDNAAGIRVMSLSVTIQNVRITYCDMGILTSTINADNLVQNSEIAYNGTGTLDGQSHNVYLTQGGTITFQFCYVHDALSGTNFKSRAHYSQLFYNYISYGAQNEVEGVDETDTETPNSNMTMIGNVVVSKPNRTLNTSQFINFGQDVGGLHLGTLYLINNTLIAGNAAIGFLRSSASDSAIVAVNNIFFGSKTIVEPGYTRGVTGNNNWVPDGASIPATFRATTMGVNPGFVNAAERDFHLLAASTARDIGFYAPTYLDGGGIRHSGVPVSEYVNDLGSTPRVADGTLDAGAYEFATAAADIASERVAESTRLPSWFGWNPGPWMTVRGTSIADASPANAFVGAWCLQASSRTHPRSDLRPIECVPCSLRGQGWPVRLNDVCSLKLVMWGSVVRGNGKFAAVSTLRHEFRTGAVRT